MKITVTKQHIKDASFCEGASLFNNCAVALAIEEQFGKTTVSCMIHLHDTNQWVKTPEHVKEWIQIFDSCTPIERLLLSPISFELELESELVLGIKRDK